MDKQSIIAFVLIGVILTVWLYLNSPEPAKQPAKPLQDSTLTAPAEKIPEVVKDTAKPEVAEKPAINNKNLYTPQDTLPEKIITVETDLFRAEFTSKGARLKKYFLKDYKTWYYKEYPNGPYYKTEVQLINQEDGGELSSTFVTKEGKIINTVTLDFTTDANNYHYKISGNDSLVLSYRFNLNGSQIIQRNFVIYGDNYRSKFEMVLENLRDEISGYSYDLQWNKGINFVEKNSVDEANHSNVTLFTGDDDIVIDAKKKDEVEKKELNGMFDWIGIKNKYFGIILAPEKTYTESGVFVEGESVDRGKYGPKEYYEAGYKIPLENKNIQRDAFDLYIGPLDYDILKSYGKRYEALYDFGSFMGMSFLIRPISEYILLPLFKFLHLFIPNYGFVIIVFSLIIKLFLYPLTRKSMQSMKKMQQLQPKIAELKEKYKDDQQKQSSETMKLYSTYGVNPAGGCLPSLLQMPILVALWSLFNVAIELRNQPFLFWIDNLSAPDVIFTMPAGFPLISTVSGLAVLMGITMFIQQKMTMKDPTQKAMVYLMPVMLTIMFMNLPAGVNLYYFMFNLLSIVQQYIINNSKNDAELVPVDKPKKEGFMQKMMRQVEEQQKTQKNPKKNKR